MTEAVRVAADARPRAGGVVLAPRLALTAVVVAYFALSLFYQTTNPIWEAPDEAMHYEHVLFILDHRALPTRQAKTGDQLHQPPLYYLVGSALVGVLNLDDNLPIKPNPYFMWRAEGLGDQPNMALHTLDESPPYTGTVLAVHLLRFLSALFCVVAVIAAYALARRIVPSRPWLAVAAAAVTGLTPQFLFVSATLSNDGPAIAFGALALLTTVEIALRAQEGQRLPWRLFALLGLWGGLGAISKLTFFGVVPAIAAASLYTLVVTRGRRRQTLGGWALVGVVTAIGGGWWYARNLLVYGTTFHIAGFGRFDARTAVEIQEKPEQMAKILAWYPEPLFQSFWLRFGWMNLYPDRWVYDLAIAACVAAVLGLVAYAVLRRTGLLAAERGSTLGLVLCALALLSTFAVTTWRFAYTIGNHYPQGRYLFPVQPATALLLVLGLATLAGLPFTLTRLWRAKNDDVRPQWWPSAMAALGLAVALGASSVGAAGAYMAPHYEQAPLWLRFDPAQAPNPQRERFGSQVSLIGYDLAAKSVGPGESVVLDLYWRAEADVKVDLQAFVHVAEASGKPVAQADGMPGGQDYPIRGWKKGEVIRDRRIVPVDAKVAPGEYSILVGLYSLQTMERVPLANGETSLRLGTVMVAPR